MASFPGQPSVTETSLCGGSSASVVLDCGDRALLRAFQGVVCPGRHLESPGLKAQTPSSKVSQLSGVQRVRMEGQCAPFRLQGDLVGS